MISGIARRTWSWTLGGRRASPLSPPQTTKELISRNFLKPSRGLEPRTPSLPPEAGAMVRVVSPPGALSSARLRRRVLEWADVVDALEGALVDADATS